MGRLALAVILAAIALSLVACTQAAAPPTPTPTATMVPPTPRPPEPTVAQPATLTAPELKGLLAGANKPLLLDTRSKTDYGAGHIPGADSLPFSELAERASSIPKDRLVIVYCSGST